jgi:hypothetical protein
MANLGTKIAHPLKYGQGEPEEPRDSYANFEMGSCRHNIVINPDVKYKLGLADLVVSLGQNPQSISWSP